MREFQGLNTASILTLRKLLARLRAALLLPVVLRLTLSGQFEALRRGIAQAGADHGTLCPVQASREW
jgi:hypothetical protein